MIRFCSLSDQTHTRSSSEHDAQGTTGDNEAKAKEAVLDTKVGRISGSVRLSAICADSCFKQHILTSTQLQDYLKGKTLEATDKTKDNLDPDTGKGTGSRGESVTDLLNRYTDQAKSEVII